MLPPSCCSTLLLLLLSFSTLYSSRAIKVSLLDTLNATSELNWRTYSNQDEKDGWLEETLYSKAENRNHQVYSTCNYESDHESENWLLIPGIERTEAQRLYLHFNFTIIRCATVEALRTSGCKETLRLYAVQMDDKEEEKKGEGERRFGEQRNWHNETKWDYVDTLASHSTTDTELMTGNNEDAAQQNLQQTYAQTSSYDVSKRFVHFALRNTGACSSILSVKIYYNVCEERVSNLLHLPRTVSSREAHGVVSVQGRCAANASPVATLVQQLGQQHHQKIVRRQFPAISAPTAICKADGSWQVLGSTECACDPGHIPSLRSGLCTACPPGTYKQLHGTGECIPCPLHSWSNVSGSTECPCSSGFHRLNRTDVGSSCKTGHLLHIQSAVGTADDDDKRLLLDADSTDFLSNTSNNGNTNWWARFSAANSAWPWVVACALLVLSLCIALILVNKYTTRSATRKQMSDLDVLENYKQDTISPDYNHSLAGLGIGGAGGCAKALGGCLGGNPQCNGGGTASCSVVRKKMLPLQNPHYQHHNTPLILAGPVGYGTHRSAAAVVVTSSGGSSTCNAQPLRTPLTGAKVPQTLRRTSCGGTGSRLYVDPTTYEDPAQMLAEFTNEINPADVEVTRLIGAGEFGEVCCARLTVVDGYGQQQQQIVAVKQLLPDSGEKAKNDLLLEASIMGQFEHENVIRLIGVVTRSEPVMLLTEYMLYGSLDQFLRSNRDGKLAICQLVKMLHGIASGMCYLTDKAYVHRDLAARNVLVDDRLTCKIADFGLSRGLRPCGGGGGGGTCEQEYTTQQGGKIPIRWTAPEAIMHHKYTLASDVWSFGIVMWEVMTFGERPYWDWTNHRVIQEVIHSGYRLPAPQDTPKRLYEIMMVCWQAERHHRPTFSQIIDHLNAFLMDVDFFYKYI